MRHGTLIPAVSIIALLAAAVPAQGIEIMRLGEGHYLVSDQATTSLSGTGSMRRKVMRVAASLCSVLAYQVMLPLNQEAGGGSFGDDNASSTMEVLFFDSDAMAESWAVDRGVGQEPIVCEEVADSKWVQRFERRSYSRET